MDDPTMTTLRNATNAWMDAMTRMENLRVSIAIMERDGRDVDERTWTTMENVSMRASDTWDALVIARDAYIDATSATI